MNDRDRVIDFLDSFEYEETNPLRLLVEEAIEYADEVVQETGDEWANAFNNCMANIIAELDLINEMV